MLRFTKRVFAILLVCSLALCAFGTVSLAEETATETIYLDPTSAGGVRPGTADYTGALEFNTTTGTGSLFQYTLANLEIPAGEALKSAHFQFVTTASPNGKFMQFQSLNCEAALPAAPTYGDLTANNFTVASTFVQAKLTEEQTSGVTMWMNRSEEVTSTSSSCMNVDVTQALKTAISGNRDYFNLLVYPYAGYYVAGINANGWTPYGGGNGVLVITTEKIATVDILGDTDGAISYKEDTQFAITANVTESSTALNTVVLTVKDESTQDVQTYDAPTINGTEYSWAFSAGLEPGTYTATVTATDVAGASVSDSVTIEIRSATGTVYIPANMLVSNGAGNNFQILNGALSHVQYDLGSYLPENSRVTDAKWYFGKSSAFTANGTLLFKEITNQVKYETVWTNALPEGLTMADSWTKVVGSVDSLYAQGTKMTNGCDYGTVSSAAGYYVTVPMTDVVAASWAAGNDYYGFGVQFDAGTNVILGRWGGTGAYWPMLEVTYEEYDAPATVTVNGATDGVITVKEDTAFNLSADVTKGTLDISSVDLYLIDSTNNMVEGIGAPSVSGDTYAWAIEGLTPGTYTAIIMVIDVNGNAVEATVTITVESKFVTVYIPSNMLVSNGAGNNFQILNGALSHVQYDLGSYLPENARVTDAKWYFGKSSEFTVSGTLLFKEITNQVKYETVWTNALPEGLTMADSWTKVVGSVDSLYAQGTKMTNGCDYGTVSSAAGYYVTVPMTDVVAASWAAGNDYYGFGVQFDAGTNVILGRWGGTGAYWPMLEVTYEISDVVPPLANHELTISDGVASASVTVNSGSAVLLVAAYDSTHRLIAIDMDDEVENSELSVSMTNTSAAYFKSFVWEDCSNDTITPLLPSIQK